MVSSFSLRLLNDPMIGQALTIRIQDKNGHVPKQENVYQAGKVIKVHSHLMTLIITFRTHQRGIRPFPNCLRRGI
jgi:hypothetical protein